MNHETKHKIRQDRTLHAIQHHSDYLSLFGYNSPDITIRINANTRNDNYANLGNAYECPDGMTVGSARAKAYMAGSENFRVREMEVYEVILKE